MLGMEWFSTFDEMAALNANQSWAPYNWWYNRPNWQMGWLFSGLIKSKYPRWWSKYTYLIYNSATIGNAFGALFMFFATIYHHIVDASWWENNIYTNTAGSNGPAVRLGPEHLPACGYFGPTNRCFPDSNGNAPKGC